MKIWSSHLLDNFKQLSHEPEKFSGDSTGFEPMRMKICHENIIEKHYTEEEGVYVENNAEPSCYGISWPPERNKQKPLGNPANLFKNN